MVAFLEDNSAFVSGSSFVFYEMAFDLHSPGGLRDKFTHTSSTDSHVRATRTS